MKKVVFLISLLLTLSCTKEMNQNSNHPKNLSISTTISPDEALSNLNSLLVKLNGETKAAEIFNMSFLQPIGGENFRVSTKSYAVDIPDTLMYVVNFAEQKGFAVLAGDTRLSDRVYCITENGNISADDFASAFEFLTTQETKAVAGEIDETFFDIGEKFVPSIMLSSMLADLQYGQIKDIETKATPVATYGTVLLKTRWTQWAPFNTYTPIGSDGRHCPTGCVATACAQIMQYCQKPSNPVFDGVPCSWIEMGTVCTNTDIGGNLASASAKDQVARFLIHIGQKPLCYIRYASDGSYGYADGVVRTLKNYGYSNVNKHLGFGASNQSKASEMLRDKKPVYLDGADYRNGGGHAWVIDGEWNGYFHCNWGWNGNWDGYYAKHNYFPISSREYFDSTDSGAANSSVANSCYDWCFRLVTYNL